MPETHESSPDLRPTLTFTRPSPTFMTFARPSLTFVSYSLQPEERHRHATRTSTGAPGVQEVRDVVLLGTASRGPYANVRARATMTTSVAVDLPVGSGGRCC
jgi:hypothetical protein